jgi:hypothetical protein
MKYLHSVAVLTLLVALKRGSFKRLALFATLCAAAFAPLASAQNAALMQPPRLQFLDANGFPLSGGLVYTCVAGSSCPGTPLATYTDSSAGTPNANPVVLDAGGYANIWLGNSSYKITLQNSVGVTQWTQDNVTAGALALSGSLAGTNGATLIRYTPAATGGQTRTLAAIHGDYIDAAGYDTITHAFADACASTPAKSVFIPASIAATQTYTNSCGAPTQDYRFGTSATPGTSRTFTTPMFGGTIYDASPATSNSLSQGDGSYAPVNSFRVFESGAATAVALYSEYHATAGATGVAYGLSANVEADQGSSPGALAHNWTLSDATHLWLTGCTRVSNSATCTISSADPLLNPPFLTGAGGLHTGNGCFFITGTSDTAFAANGNVQCGTFSNGGYTVTFANTGSNTTIGPSGWIAPSHQVFGFELNLNNAAHDPGPITALGQGFPYPLPFWGMVVTPTPFTWNNPTGGAVIVNQPITAGFYAAGGGNRALAGSQYYGFVTADAINDMYVAGTPQVGGSVSTAASGFRARPTGAATIGQSYPSHKSCWDDSITNGTAQGFTETQYCVNLQPVSTSATNSDSALVFGQTGWGTVQFTKPGHVRAESGSSSDVAFGFNGYTNGIYNASGITTNAGTFASTGSINAVSGFQTNGTAGANTTITCTAGQHISGITVVGGLVTAVGACN